MKRKPDIILHSCCAPCATYPAQLLTTEFSPTLYFYNPNIYPEDEYRLRSEEISWYARKINCEALIGPYDVWKFERAVAGLELLGEGSERCWQCFMLRFEQTAQLCLDRGIQRFTSTLSISPHKNYAMLTEIGESVAAKYGCIFVPYNFRKGNGFTISSRMSHEAGMYRQNYCGCQWSFLELEQRLRIKKRKRHGDKLTQDNERVNKCQE